MGKHLVTGVSTLLLSAATMMSGGAFANGTLTVTLADYNSAQVAQNNYVVTVPEYSSVNGTLYDTHYTLTAGTELEAGSFLTLTLPAGFTFASTPRLFYDGTYLSPNSNVIGSETATFTMTTAILASAGFNIYVYPQFMMNTPTSFASAYGGNSLPLSIQATGNAASSNNDPNPVSQPAFNHAVGSLPETITPGSGQIDLANPFYGDQFVASGNTIADSGFVATFAINTETNDPFNSNAVVLTPAGTLNTLAPSDTANITVEGYFNGIGLAYADTNTGVACQSLIPGGAGVYAGTVTNGSISFSGVPINTAVQICIIPYGVMWANNLPYVYTYSAGAGVTDYFGGLAQTTANNFYTYNSPSTTVVEILGGSPQSATVGTGFCKPLAVKVYDTSTNPPYLLNGIDVIFDAPRTGQSGSFDGSDLVGTDANGIAVAPSFVANSTPGVYTVTANVGTTQAVFGLTNEVGVSDQVYCNGFEY